MHGLSLLNYSNCAKLHIRLNTISWRNVPLFLLDNYEEIEIHKYRSNVDGQHAVQTFGFNQQALETVQRNCAHHFPELMTFTVEVDSLQNVQLQIAVPLAQFVALDHIDGTVENSDQHQDEHIPTTILLLYP